MNVPNGLRRDVVLSNRILHAAGLVTAYGHASARIPGTETFLMPTRASPALAREDRLLILDLDGNVLEGSGTPNKEVWIHARIYASRPEVGSVVHVHSPACVVLGQIGWTVRPFHNAGATLGLEIPVYERVGLIVNRQLGDEVAAVMGGCKAMLLRGHGANVAADTLRRATVLACLLEEAADLQLKALAVTGPEGRGIRFFDEAEVALALQQQDAATSVERGWEYYTALATGGL
jgi:ribulose-5-phosphate 4-epimerase/fuculose-1-phosphate aldolase